MVLSLALCEQHSSERNVSPSDEAVFTLSLCWVMVLECFQIEGKKRLFIYLFISTLFNDVVTNSDYRLSSGLMIVNNELGKAIEGRSRSR
jgi:hypothetical protein